VLTVVVFVHEFGHFWVGRLCGVGVKAFSIGFGKELFGWTDRHGTRWRIAAVPLGGYVKFVGDMNVASAPDEEALAGLTPAERRVSFHHQPLLSRAAIVAAGPVANFILAIAVFAAVAFFSGRAVLAPRVESVAPASAAEEAGFRAGDLVLSIDGRAIDEFDDIKRIVSTSAGDRLVIVVERSGAKVELVATPSAQAVPVPGGSTQRFGQLGIRGSSDPADVRHVRYGFLDALGRGWTETWNIVAGTGKFLQRLVRGQESAQQLSGPIGIMMISGDVAAKLGFGSLALGLLPILSVSIGLLNLFPVPMLDGGHLLFYAIEAARGRPLSDRAQEIGFRIGLALVVMLMLFTTWNDIVNRVAAFVARGT
jgi:regulator of sigma E protease